MGRYRAAGAQRPLYWRVGAPAAGAAAAAAAGVLPQSQRAWRWKAMLTRARILELLLQLVRVVPV